MGWIDTFRLKYPKIIKYTWWSQITRGREKNVGMRLDYVVINKEYADKVIDSCIFNEFYGSDHCPVGIYLNLSSN
jgi:exodeoxyribonuclease-3